MAASYRAAVRAWTEYRRETRSAGWSWAIERAPTAGPRCCVACVNGGWSCCGAWTSSTPGRRPHYWPALSVLSGSSQASHQI